jgi:hypothetical protein
MNTTSPRLTATPGFGWRLIAFWILYSIFRFSCTAANLRSAGEPVSYAALVLRTLISSAIWTLLTLLMFAICDAAFSAARGKLARRAIFAAGFLLISGLGLIAFELLRLVLNPPALIDTTLLARDMARQIWAMILMTTCVAVVARGMYWWKAEVRLRQRNEDIEATLVRTELSVLSDQLEPHFLLNTITAVSTLASRDVPAAQEMMRGLQDLLDYSVGRGGAAVVRLREELHFIRQYLRLHQLRFPGKLRFTISAPQELLDAALPRLILQPVVENALKHGVAQMEEGGRITVGVAPRERAMVVSVRNSNGGTPAAPGIGIGVACVRARLKLLFGEEPEVTMADDAATRTTCVTIEIPLTETTEEEAA